MIGRAEGYSPKIKKGKIVQTPAFVTVETRPFSKEGSSEYWIMTYENRIMKNAVSVDKVELRKFARELMVMTQ